MQNEDRRYTLTIGRLNLIRADVKKATDDAFKHLRLNKDYCVIWWVARNRYLYAIK